MKEELEQKLIKDFPDLFKSQDWWGCECSDGWFSIIYTACEYIKNLNNKDIYIVQIKEKFAGLRIYLNASTSEINAITEFAELLSYRTCEYCGTTVDVGITISGWNKSLCKSCWETNTKIKKWQLNDVIYEKDV